MEQNFLNKDFQDFKKSDLTNIYNKLKIRSNYNNLIETRNAKYIISGYKINKKKQLDFIKILKKEGLIEIKNKKIIKVL